MLQAIAAGPRLRGAGGRPRLIVELTETAEIEDVAGAAATIGELRAAGVPVCIDDFGAGNAAFRYLRDFAVDFVKIDGSYVQGAVHNAQERNFVTAMVNLARSVGAQVVAEMIETEAQATLMATLQVEFGQGWLFGRPGKLVAAA
jgi:EAL domain-containing protein (putative c-di-GMP-specific phosphodiesterase class I)